MPRAKKRPGTAVDRRNGEPLSLIHSGQPAPEPPSGLLASSVQAWERYWADSVASVATTADRGLVERWITAVDEHARAIRAFKKEPVVAGSTGQPRLNPLAAWIESRERVIKEAEDRLGLSPLSRMKLGVAVGEAHRSLDVLNAALETDGDDADVDDFVIVEGELA